MINKSPYLEHNRRLADVITAIQVMATYPRHTSRDLKKWAKRLGEPVSSTTWETVITDHPEFFRKRIDNEDEDNSTIKVSLNWRWSMDRNYSPDLGRCLTEDELNDWKEQPKEDRRRLTKPPLSSEQTEILINTAISLHSSAIANEQQRRWWLPIIVPAITALIGAILGFYGSMLKSGIEMEKGKTAITQQQPK